MKHFILTLLTTITYSSAVYAQKDTLFFDADWQLTTRSKASFYRPTPKSDGLGNVIRDYYISGAIQMEGTSTNETSDGFDGKITWYYESGKIMQEANYKNGTSDGLLITYDENGNIASKGTYKEGQPQDGNFYFNYITYKTLAYYTNGILQKQEVLSNSTLSKARYEVFYNEDQTYKKLLYYNNDGSLLGQTEKLNSENAIIEGLEVQYNMNPLTVASIATVKKGRYVETKKYFFSSGKIKMQDFISDQNEITKEVYFDTNGKATDTIILKDMVPYEGRQYVYFSDYSTPFEYDKVKSISSYKNGYLDGPFTVYFPNGRVGMKVNYKDGTEDGDKIQYDSLGNIQFSMKYISGQAWEGTEKESDSTILTYKKGELVSEKKFFPNGRPSSIKTLEEGETFFDSVGNVLSRLKYKDGAPFLGKRITYSNGVISKEEEYKNGVVTSDVSYENGVPSARNDYNADGRNLKKTTYHTNGKPFLETIFENDEEREIRYFSADGQLLGKLTTGKDYNRNGDMYNFDEEKLSSIQTYKANQVIHTRQYYNEKLVSDTYQNGQSVYNDLETGKSYTCTLKDGEPYTGVQLEYNEYNYSVNTLIHYKNGEKDGEAITYKEPEYESMDNIAVNPHLIAKKTNYLAGTKDGLEEEYSDGKLMKSANFKNDIQSGETRFYSKEGKLLSTVLYIEGVPVNGKVYDYNENYGIASVSNYKDGKQDGETTVFKDDRVESIQTFMDGEPTKKISYTKNNQSYTLTFKYGKPDEGAEIESYTLSEYKKGELIKETTYTDSAFEKIDKIITYNGTDYETKKFFACSSVKTILAYKDNVPDGEALFYNINGKSIARGIYSNGLPASGSFAFYNATDEISYIKLSINGNIVTFTEYINNSPGREIQFTKFDLQNSTTIIEGFVEVARTLFPDYSYEL